MLCITRSFQFVVVVYCLDVSSRLDFHEYNLEVVSRPIGPKGRRFSMSQTRYVMLLLIDIQCQ